MRFLLLTRTSIRIFRFVSFVLLSGINLSNFRFTSFAVARIRCECATRITPMCAPSSSIRVYLSAPKFAECKYLSPKKSDKYTITCHRIECRRQWRWQHRRQMFIFSVGAWTYQRFCTWNERKNNIHLTWRRPWTPLSTLGKVRTC